MAKGTRGRPRKESADRLSEKDIYDDEDGGQRTARPNIKGSATRRMAMRWIMAYEAETKTDIDSSRGEWGTAILSEARQKSEPIPLFIYKDLPERNETWDQTIPWVKRAAMGLSNGNLSADRALETSTERQKSFDWLLWCMARTSGFFWPDALVNAWFSGHIRPSREELYILGKGLGVNPSWLISGDGDLKSSGKRTDLNEAIATIEREIEGTRSVVDLPSGNLLERITGAMIKRGAIVEGGEIKAGLRYLTGDAEWISLKEIKAGSIKNPDRLKVIAERCSVPFPWILEGKTSEITVIRHIEGMRGPEEALAFLEGLDEPTKPAPRSVGRARKAKPAAEIAPKETEGSKKRGRPRKADPEAIVSPVEMPPEDAQKPSEPKAAAGKKLKQNTGKSEELVPKTPRNRSKKKDAPSTEPMTSPEPDA